MLYTRGVYRVLWKGHPPHPFSVDGYELLFLGSMAQFLVCVRCEAVCATGCCEVR